MLLLQSLLSLWYWPAAATRRLAMPCCQALAMMLILSARRSWRCPCRQATNAATTGLGPPLQIPSCRATEEAVAVAAKLLHRRGRCGCLYHGPHLATLIRCCNTHSLLQHSFGNVVLRLQLLHSRGCPCCCRKTDAAVSGLVRPLVPV